ncbi:DUF397 domain-containing protein [Streptomyces millisiae]|uniref:DUF397 domain-containing protein n=1 Tax=Streptomyces millisiae TaxID=3075542 RepID=A0ABU2LV82_9ACTN|nr:DUF397 domain-containing protein [Streptomyces sp. DSM 44918]MDT0321506.1 DUF397 domain-containing protein [Streptomyces sp. DSM 44918]
MPNLQWQKSSFSGGSGSGECVELAAISAGGVVLLRESDDADTILAARPDACRALLAQIKRGRLGSLSPRR